MTIQRFTRETPSVSDNANAGMHDFQLKKNRFTGREVDLSGLGEGAYWIGDNLALDNDELIFLGDIDGNQCFASPDELLSHPVWSRLDRYSRMRIEGGLNMARNVRMRRRIEVPKN